MSTPTLTTEQYERLPQWAQRHIDRLTRDLNSARDRIEDLTRQAKGSPVTVDPYGDHPYHLPAHSTIEFTVSKDLTVRAHLRREADGGMVLDLNSTGAKHLGVLPRASNSVYIRGVSA